MYLYYLHHLRSRAQSTGGCKHGACAVRGGWEALRALCEGSWCEYVESEHEFEPWCLTGISIEPQYVFDIWVCLLFCVLVYINFCKHISMTNTPLMDLFFPPFMYTSYYMDSKLCVHRYKLSLYRNKTIQEHAHSCLEPIERSAIRLNSGHGKHIFDEFIISLPICFGLLSLNYMFMYCEEFSEMCGFFSTNLFGVVLVLGLFDFIRRHFSYIEINRTCTCIQNSPFISYETVGGSRFFIQSDVASRSSHHICNGKVKLVACTINLENTFVINSNYPDLVFYFCATNAIAIFIVFIDMQFYSSPVASAFATLGAIVHETNRKSYELDFNLLKGLTLAQIEQVACAVFPQTQVRVNVRELGVPGIIAYTSHHAAARVYSLFTSSPLVNVDISRDKNGIYFLRVLPHVNMPERSSLLKMNPLSTMQDEDGRHIHERSGDGPTERIHYLHQYRPPGPSTLAEAFPHLATHPFLREEHAVIQLNAADVLQTSTHAIVAPSAAADNIHEGAGCSGAIFASPWGTSPNAVSNTSSVSNYAFTEPFLRRSIESTQSDSEELANSAQPDTKRSRKHNQRTRWNRIAPTFKQQFVLSVQMPNTLRLMSSLPQFPCQLASFAIPESERLSRTATISVLATSLKVCETLISRLALRGLRGKKDATQSFMVAMLGKLREPILLLAAHAWIHSKEQVLLFLIVHSKELKISVVFEEFNDGMFLRLCELSDATGALGGATSYVALATTRLGENNAMEHVIEQHRNERGNLDTRFLATQAHKLKELVQSICAADETLEAAIVLRDPGTPEWNKRFGNSPKDSLGNIIAIRTLTFPADPTKAGFSHANLVSACNATAIANMQTGLEINSYTRLLKCLVQNPLFGAPTTLLMSHYLAPFGPSVLETLLVRYRSAVYLNRPSHRAHVSQTETPLNESQWLAIATFIYDDICCADVVPLPGMTPEHAIGPSEDASHEDRSEFNYDDDCGLPGAEVENTTCVGMLDESLPSGTDGSNRFDGSLSFSSSTHISPNIRFMEFLKQQATLGNCIYNYECPQGQNALFAFSPYDCGTLQLTNGPPVLVEYTEVSRMITTTCTCAGARLATCCAEQISYVPGLSGGRCFHEAVLRYPIFVQDLASRAAAKCDPVSGILTCDVVLVLGATSSANRKYVYVHCELGLGSPGNMKDAVVTLSLVRNCLQASCNSCGNPGKAEKGVKNRANCRHFDLIKACAKEPQFNCLAPFFAVSAPQTKASVYNEHSQRWAFPSFDAIQIENLKKTGVLIPPPAFPSLPHGVYMGGAGDPRTQRFKILTDAYHMKDVVEPLLSSRLVSVRCPCQQTAKLLFMKPQVVNLTCSSCTLSIGLGSPCMQCQKCARSLCLECSKQCTASATPAFGDSFQEFAHMYHPPNSIVLYFSSLVEKIVRDGTGIVDVLHLKPPLPGPIVPIEPSLGDCPLRELISCGHLLPFLASRGTAVLLVVSRSMRSALMGLKGCTYSESGYVAVRSSNVYGMTHTEKATVYELCCSKKHPACTIPFLGQQRAMHCQTAQSIFRVELFDLYWFILRRMKSAAISTFSALVQEIYSRNNGGHFANEGLFRDAFFGYMSSLQIDFRVKCPSCPVGHDSVTGELYTKCLLGIDAVTLRCALDDAQPFDAPMNGAPSINCKGATVLSRMFFPGKKKSEIGVLRTELGIWCKRVLQEPHDAITPAISLQFQNFLDRIHAINSLRLYVPAMKTMGASFSGERPTLLERNIATMFLRMSNEQGEINEIMNESEISFVFEVLRRNRDGSLSPVFLRLEKQDKSKCLRTSIVDLVLSALVSRTDNVLQLSATILVDAVKLMLETMHIASSAALALAGDEGIEKPIPKEQRSPANPSTSGIVINLTRSGEQLRHAPKFVGDASSKRGKEHGVCQKPQQMVNKHQRHLNQTQGLLNVVCLISLVPVAFMIMRSPEGPSMGVKLFYMFLPYYPRLVICDTGCQTGTWARSHLRRFFMRWRFACDKFHGGGHKCKLVTDAREFSVMKGKNDSFVEQLHAMQRSLGMTMASSSTQRATFLVQLINYDIYNNVVEKARIPLSRRAWPEAASVPVDVPGDAFGADIAGAAIHDDASGDDAGEIVDDSEDEMFAADAGHVEFDDDDDDDDDDGGDARANGMEGEDFDGVDD